MRKTYITPSMILVKLQASGLVCLSLNNLSGNAGLSYEGSDEFYEGDTRAKVSSSIWDDEW